MRWQDFRRSDNVEESSDGGSSGIGGIHLGIGGGIIVIVVSLLLGKNPLDVLALLNDSGATTPSQKTREGPRSARHPPRHRRGHHSHRRQLVTGQEPARCSGASDR